MIGRRWQNWLQKGLQMHGLGKQVFWKQSLSLLFSNFDSEIYTGKDMFARCTLLGREAEVIAIQN